MAFYDVFEELCEKAHTTPAQVRKDLGISQSTMASWKSRGLTPKTGTLQRLADYFGVSVNFLVKMDNTIAKFNIPKEAAERIFYSSDGKELDEISRTIRLTAFLLTNAEDNQSEFNEFKRFIETLGYYTELDGDNYRLYKGNNSVVVTLDELKALVRASKVTVAALVQNLMDTVASSDAPEAPQKSE